MTRRMRASLPAISRRSWITMAVLLAVLMGVVALWRWTPLQTWIEPERLSEMLQAYRSRWFVLPLVIGVFVVAELVMFPLLVLIFVCGLAFGPWLGAAYAMAGTVASAILPFLAGRWLGRRRLARWGGLPARRLMRRLKRGGVVAVFLVRKVPAPFTPVNVICGACGLRLLDFVAGTALGVLTGIILITVLGAQMFEIVSDPQPARIGLALGTLAGAVGLALLLQRVLNRRLAGRA